jgi:hypothetical protein
MENEGQSLNHFFGLSGTKVSVIILLIPGLEVGLLSGENLQVIISFGVGSTLAPLLNKKDEGSVRSHLRSHNDKDRL